MTKDKWHTAAIAIGSNIGDTKQHLNNAVKELIDCEHIKDVHVSKYIETEPYGYVDQDKFLNGALICKTNFSPYELLDFLHLVEKHGDRVRKIHWGPRTIDLDIIFYDDLIMSEEDLIIPHTDMHNRDFVLGPLAELIPDFVHPVKHKTVKQLYEELS